MEKALVFIALFIALILAVNFIADTTIGNGDILKIPLREVNNYRHEDFYVQYQDLILENQQEDIRRRRFYYGW